MALVDRRVPRAFLAAGYAADDWIAILLKSYGSGQVLQRVLPVATVASDRFMAWLRAKNAQRWEVCVATNAVMPAQQSRTRQHIAAVRHVFIETDAEGDRLLAVLAQRSGLPPPSYLLRTSVGRVHVLWRVQGFDMLGVEALQKHLARELCTDTAATSAAQMTRLPGFFNHKYRHPFAISLELGTVNRVYGPGDFPEVRPPRRVPARTGNSRGGSGTLARVQAYLRSVPPAVAGERGDAHTFRVCCRVVRGFALDDEDALAALAEWNDRCLPPWRLEELTAKVRNARRYGRESVGNRLEGGRHQ